MKLKPVDTCVWPLGCVDCPYRRLAVTQGDLELHECGLRHVGNADHTVCPIPDVAEKATMGLLRRIRAAKEAGE